jgi:hypothetical protein
MFKHHHTWEKLYNDIKGGVWPNEVPLEVDFFMLPQYMQERFIEVGYDPHWSSMERFTSTGPNQYQIFYSQECNGGGTAEGQEFPKILKERYPDRVFNRVYEWCSGPGFISFSLLDHGIARTACLSDIYNPALTWAEETINYPSNDLKSRANTYLLNDLALLPKQEMFDLVVSNPPNAKCLSSHILSDNLNRLTTDLNWEGHINFYKHIKSHLSSDGIILMQETHAGSALEDFLPMIDAAGLKILDSWRSKDYYVENYDQEWDQKNPDHDNPRIQCYYIEMTHK